MVFIVLFYKIYIVQGFIMSIVLQMALPYEVGLYHKFDMGGTAQKPIGCPGMNLTEE